MSRLIVKNLPAYLTQDRLREHFESKDGPGGTLTDVKVVLKPDGTSRRFGFIGYKTDSEAEKAKKWFDRTFIHSSRISVTVVEVCGLYTMSMGGLSRIEFRVLRMHLLQGRTNGPVSAPLLLMWQFPNLVRAKSLLRSPQAPAALSYKSFSR